jgi:gliding motility-associated-like protein
MLPGDVSVFVETYTIQPADLIGNGTVLNTATASGTDPNGDPVTDDDTEIVVEDANEIIANDDVYNGVSSNDGGVVGSLYDNDTLEGNPVNPSDVTYTENSNSSNGNITVDVPSGNITVVPGTPAGTYTIGYTICENINPTNCDDAIITINVVPEPDTFYVEIPEDSIYEFCTDTTVNFFNPITSSSICGLPSNGSLISDGGLTCYTYIPTPSWNGNDTLCIITCAGGLCDTTILIITVVPVNDPPIANDDFETTNPGTPIDIDVTVNDTDIDGNIDPTSVVIVTPPTQGTATVDPITGVITYTPNGDACGLDSLQYLVFDDGFPLPALSDDAWVYITIIDDVPPTIICQSDFTVNVSTSTCAGLVVLTPPTVSDNCDFVVLTGPFTSPINGLISGGQWPVGVHTVTYNAVDGSGNTASCSHTVTVIDNIFPVIVGCPQDILVNNTPSLCGAFVSWTVPSALDNCGVSSYTSTHDPGDLFPVGSTTVTYTAVDGGGNVATCSFVVTVSDNEAPVVINCPSNIVANTVLGLCEGVGNWIIPTATDNCGVVTVTSTHNPGDLFPVGTTTVTYTFSDGAIPANITICSFTVTVFDNQAPVISGCPPSITVTNDPGDCGAIVSWAAPTVTDNCGVLTYTNSHVPGSFFPIGTTSVTYIATDAAGFVTVCQFNIIVEDTELPTIVCPADMIVNVSPSTCAGLVVLTPPTFADNCPDFVVTGPIISPISGLISGGQWPVGIYTVSYIITDASGNQDSCSYTVTVNDNSAPVIVGCPDNITVNNAPGLCGANVSWAVPSALDDCGVITFTSTDNPGDFFTVGTHTVIYTAIDASGNVDSCSFVITVIDNEFPSVSDCPDNIVVSTDAGLCEAIVTWTVPTATDNCGVVTVTSTNNSGDVFPVGTTTVTYTFTDGANPANVSICTFTVTVVDNEAPVIADCPQDTTVSSDPGACGAIVNWTVPTATDNCGVTFTSSHNSGDFFPIGTTTVTYTAVDSAGNITICEFDVTVEDTEAPSVVCPSDITVTAIINSCWMQVWYDVVVTDNCGNSDVTVSYSAQPGSIFTIGDSTVVVTVTDASGNVSTCSFVVTVIDPQAPVINVCPIDFTINNATDSCGGFASWILPTVFDNCDFELTNTVVYPPGFGFAQNVPNTNNYFPVGTSTVTYIATDLSGGSATCTFQVTVVDVQAPTFVVAPQDTTIYAVADDCSAPYSWPEPVVIDNCEVDTVFFETVPAGFNNGDDFPVGETTVIYTAIDIYGNSSNHTFIITVIDTTGPVFDNCPADIVINSTPGECGVFVFWPEVTATDNCQVASIVADINSGTYFLVGTWPVVITATDIYGNTTLCEFTVTVVDAEAPVFESVPSDFFICAVDTATFDIQTQIMDALIVTDNCGVLSVEYADFDWVIGENNVNIIATDVNGNTADTVVVVTVYPMPTVTLISDSLAFCSGEAVTLVVQDPNQNNQYVWSHVWGTVIGVGPTYSFNPIRPQNEGTYVVTATNEFGCTATAQIAIDVNDCSIVIPEFFSPGGDGINDFFVIENLEAYPGTKVLIFNRWGTQVYQSEDYLNNWDGTSDSRFNVGGDQLPEGTYFYVLTLGGQENDATFGNVYTGYIYLKR